MSIRLDDSWLELRLAVLSRSFAKTVNAESQRGEGGDGLAEWLVHLP